MKRLIFLLWLFATPLYAVEPDEVLTDPGLEARARSLSQELRCLVCRNESIDESNAEVARDLRLLVRERIMEGDADDEVLAFVVHRYGEYVLLNPRADGANLVLWMAGPVMLLIALGLGFGYVRRRSRASTPGFRALSADEKQRLDEILKE
ncbi:cytochrome c-type biogenesis protein [Cognatishimia sp. D5M38]|uniref:Cytochrome c-type biogenesis protein n=1 Tax=Cognatishimia coralii TaxID=3083254 RepID=A0ABU8QBW2_9RHOB